MFNHYIKFIFLTVICLFLNSPAQSAECTSQPSCSQLGYSKTLSECSGRASLQCPFDSSLYFCSDIAKIGDIYYTDGTISSEVISGKTPMGIVYRVDGIHGDIINIEPIDASFSLVYTNVSCLTDYKENTAARADLNGFANTNCIATTKTLSDYPAFEHCYQLSLRNDDNHKWYLPTIGEFEFHIGPAISKINSALSKLGKEPYKWNTQFWSSTEGSEYSIKNDARYYWPIVFLEMEHLDSVSTTAKTSKNKVICSYHY